jgi:hypothetical protein
MLESPRRTAERRSHLAEALRTVLTDTAYPGKFAKDPKAPSMTFSRVHDTLIALRVDDAYVAGPRVALPILVECVAIKASSIVGSGMGFDHDGAARARAQQGTWIKDFGKCADRRLELTGMTNCSSSTSPKLDKQNMDGDDEDLKDLEVYRSTVRLLRHLAQRRPDTQSTVRWLCKRLTKPNVQSDQQLMKLLRYLKGARDLVRQHGDQWLC